MSGGSRRHETCTRECAKCVTRDRLATRARAYRDRVAYKLRDRATRLPPRRRARKQQARIFLDDRDRCVLLHHARPGRDQIWLDDPRVLPHGEPLPPRHAHRRARACRKGMCELNGAYAALFNAKHGRINHLFGKRYWSDELRRRPLAHERACRYVVQNPRRAGVDGPLEEHAWTSYAATIGHGVRVAFGSPSTSCSASSSVERRSSAIDELPASSASDPCRLRDTSGGSRRDAARAARVT